jgi:hypothetical protein
MAVGDAGVNQSPTGFVLKVYMTEADAYSDTNALGVHDKRGYGVDKTNDTGALSNDTCDVHTTSGTATAHSTHPDGYYHYFIFEEYYYRIEANGLAKEFEIDWDDGEDNSPEKSNTTKIVLENPNTFAVTSHIYTTHGAHYPLIRVKSIEGFWSKWYTSASENNDFTNLDTSHRIDANLYDAGNNNFSIVTMEKVGQPRIPILCPANKPPICVLKTDRKSIFAGIDNSYLGIADISSASVDPQVVIHSENTARTDAYIRILYLDSGAAANTSADAGDNARIQEVKKKHSDTLNNVRRILRVELIDNRETTSATETSKLASGERIHIYFTIGSDTVSLGYVSLGNPVIEDNALGFFATVDATESRTRASNVTLGGQSLDDGVVPYTFFWDREKYYGGTLTYIQEDNPSRYAYLGSDSTQGPTSYGVQKVSYTHSPQFNMLDDDNRFLPEGRLIQCQVTDSSATTRIADAIAGDDNDKADALKYSWIETFSGKSLWNGDTDDDGTIENDASHSHILRRPTDLKKFAIMYRTHDGDTGTPTWTDMDTAYNGVGTYMIEGSNMSGTSLTTGNYKTFVIIAKNEKYDKLYVRTVLDGIDTIFNNISHQGASDGNFPSVEIQLFYPALEKGYNYGTSSENIVRFKPLKFIDNTSFDGTRGKSLCRSGILDFDAPMDWAKTKKTMVNPNIGTDNFLNNLANPWDVDSYALIVAIGVDASSGGGADTNLAKIKIPYITVANGSHLTYLDVIDPTCLSLNNMVNAQAVAFNRKGKYQVIENRLGTAEIRKIGASGGRIKFGGVDLTNDVAESRKTCYRYQRDATPVFLDVDHKNGDTTRFFGTITEMSEDHPTGGMLPKYALSLQVSSIAMFDSSGLFLSDGLVSLGGEIDKQRFVGFGGHT